MYRGRADTVSDVSIRSDSGLRSRGWPLRAYFALLVVVFVVTSAGATAYVFWQSGRDGRRDAQRDARFAARTSATQLGNAVANLQATVKGVAGTPQIEQALTGTQRCTLQYPPTGGLEERSHRDPASRRDGGVLVADPEGERSA